MEIVWVGFEFIEIVWFGDCVEMDWIKVFIEMVWFGECVEIVGIRVFIDVVGRGFELIEVVL